MAKRGLPGFTIRIKGSDKIILSSDEPNLSDEERRSRFPEGWFERMSKKLSQTQSLYYTQHPEEYEALLESDRKKEEEGA